MISRKSQRTKYPAAESAQAWSMTESTRSHQPSSYPASTHLRFAAIRVASPRTPSMTGEEAVISTTREWIGGRVRRQFEHDEGRPAKVARVVIVPDWQALLTTLSLTTALVTSNAREPLGRRDDRVTAQHGSDVALIQPIHRYSCRAVQSRSPLVIGLRKISSTGLTLDPPCNVRFRVVNRRVEMGTVQARIPRP